MATNPIIVDNLRMMHAPSRMVLVSVSILATLIACSRARVSVPTPTTTLSSDSYVDLKAGWTLRIVVPLLRSGQSRPQLLPEKAEGTEMAFSAADLLGFTTSHYAVIGKNDEVRLKFISAEESREGKSAPATTAPKLPFALPRRAQHIRLVYFVRASQADHNMAIAGSRQLDALNAFANQLQKDPSVCHTDSQIFCSWVPAGIAVRPETNASSATRRVEP